MTLIVCLETKPWELWCNAERRYLFIYSKLGDSSLSDIDGDMKKSKTYCKKNIPDHKTSEDTQNITEAKP